jgi:hypothetical protein
MDLKKISHREIQEKSVEYLKNDLAGAYFSMIFF